MADEEDEGQFGGLYDGGHWVWDHAVGALVYLRPHVSMAQETLAISAKAPTGTVEFRDDIDLIEQIRFRRRYQRKLKPGQPDIITLQDVKDIALYTAPLNIMSPVLINMLHLPTTERFIRSLIFLCQYYLQVADEMMNRILELENKVRTSDGDVIEAEFAENISDLRLLVAKEYCTMLIGGCDTKKYHHMGPMKKRRSLSDKDARLIETLIRMSVQVVWLALGRKSFNQIELEVNRLFKTEIFNVTEHILKTGYVTRMSPQERCVLLGSCVKFEKKLKTKSPLMNEVVCHRPIDYRHMGIGVIHYDTLPTRLKYLQKAISAPEEELKDSGVTVGILGMPRSKFDTMLHPLPSGPTTKSKAGMSNRSTGVNESIKCTGSSKKSTVGIPHLYDDIVLPPKQTTAEKTFPVSFPDTPAKIRPCSMTQLRRWQNRLMRILHPPR